MISFDVATPRTREHMGITFVSLVCRSSHFRQWPGTARETEMFVFSQFRANCCDILRNALNRRDSLMTRTYGNYTYFPSLPVQSFQALTRHCSRDRTVRDQSVQSKFLRPLAERVESSRFPDDANIWELHIFPLFAGPVISGNDPALLRRPSCS